MTNKENVYESYNKIAKWYDEHRSRELVEKPYLDMVIANIKPRAKILDLGCGMGEPIAEYFINKHYNVTGVDGSKSLIDLARSRFKNTKFFVSDMRDINFREKFDVIIAWNSLFHLSQNDQRKMFGVFESHIAVNGTLLFTTGPSNGEVWSDNGGENLYHASCNQEEYKQLLSHHHFEIITYKIEDEHCGNASVWLAKYTECS